MESLIILTSFDFDDYGNYDFKAIVEKVFDGFNMLLKLYACALSFHSRLYLTEDCHVVIMVSEYVQALTKSLSLSH